MLREERGNLARAELGLIFCANYGGSFVLTTKYINCHGAGYP